MLAIPLDGTTPTTTPTTPATIVQTAHATLYCGDALDVLPTIPAASIDAVITDPPYGIDYQSCWTDSPRPKIANDTEPYTAWIPGVVRVLREGGVVCCFCRWDVEHVFRAALQSAGLDLLSQVVWDKHSHGMGDLTGDVAPAHETIIMASRGRWRWPGRRMHSVIRYPRVPPAHLSHPNEKPVDLMAHLIEHTTTPGQTVLDCFMGSGPTAIAAGRLGRQFVGIELSAEYVGLTEARLASDVVALV